MKGHSSIGDGRKLGSGRRKKTGQASSSSSNWPCGCNSGAAIASAVVRYTRPVVNNNDGEVLRAPTRHISMPPTVHCGSSHPQNPDYIYHMEEAKATKNSGTKRWTRDIMAMSSLYNFAGIEIVDVNTGRCQ